MVERGECHSDETGVENAKEAVGFIFHAHTNLTHSEYRALNVVLKNMETLTCEVFTVYTSLNASNATRRSEKHPGGKTLGGVDACAVSQ